MTTPEQLPPPHRPRPSAPWQVVARREVMAKLTDRTFVVSTLVSVLIIGVIVGIQVVLAQRTTTETIAVTDDRAAAVVAGVDAAAQEMPVLGGRTRYETVRVASDAAARTLVADDDADAYLAVGPDGWTLLGRSAPGATTQLFLGQVIADQTMADNAARAGTSLETLRQGTDLQVETLDGARSGLATGVGFAFALLFYMSALTFGIQIATSVVEEKQSRIVEILATAIPVRQLLYGKVLGNTALAVGQMVLYTGLGLVGLSFSNYAGIVSSLAGSVAWFLVFFLAGFAALACVWAASGAMASRNEDIGATSGPLMWVTMIAFFAALFVPDGLWQQLLSYVPVVSSILMPMRLADGNATWWEPVIALLVTLAFGVAMVRLGERLYRNSLYHTSGKLSLRQAFAGTD